MTTVKNIIRRITLFYLLTVLLSLLVIGQIIYLQFFTDLKDKAEIIKKEKIQACRGNIYTHDMQLLTVSIPTYEIRVDFYDMKMYLVENNAQKMSIYYNKLRKDLKNRIKELGLQSKEEIKKMNGELEKRIKERRKSDTIAANIYIDSQIKSLADSLSNLFKDKSAAEYESFIKTCCRKSIKKINTINGTAQESYRNKRIGPKNIAAQKIKGQNDIDYIELKRLLEFPVFRLGKGISGLIIKEKPFRIPVYGSLARTVLGRINSSNFASSGIEKSFDEYLCGKDGSQAVAGGKPINSAKNILPESGCDVVTTLDLNIQETAEKALMRQIETGNAKGIKIEGGTAIVMETATGEIRAIANLKRNYDGTYNETYNYALMERSNPGSTFKLASLIAMLDDEFVDLHTVVETAQTWTYTGKDRHSHKFNEADGHNYGVIPVKQVFAKSSNVGFAKLTVKYYEKNQQKFFDKLQSMGLFMKSMNLQIEGERKPFMTAPNDTAIKWEDPFLPLSAIGYQLELAPIHTLTFYNAVANNGKMMKPKFVKKILHHGQVIKSYPDEVLKNQICSKETLAKAREALQSVVDSGTVKQFNNLPFDFSGKTGTAQRYMDGKYKDRTSNTAAYQATFVGYIPSDKPKYSIIVALYSPKIKGRFYGASYAAPVFVEIAKKLYSSDINWYKPVERNDDSLCLPDMKNTVVQQIKTIASKLDIPVDNNAKNNDWVKISKNDSKLTTTKMQIDDDKVPSVINMGLRDAVYLLEKSGMKVNFSGKGKVKKQSISAGTPIIKGATIYLELEI
ncbi:MAG: PASTA domain-containing protein [Prevotellaceae bacterium]|jgi:cell division protein FtsI (penicillin-binding protein 3)|nr:PASTA domain-containing protein [Prevotellaceae bacterium]